ncbi:GNAT family N-acetyltransferase [Halobacteriales archaeon QS_8_69_26]|nr:MAG: GNAT family N-acetyltransferase [Halobacteriales archaeon QS_8_69_26]
MRIEPAEGADVSRLADLWVDLATEQRDHGTHLLPEGNRSTVHQDLMRRTITGDVLVARGSPGEDGSDARSEGDGADGDDIVGFVSFAMETSGYDQDVERGMIFNIYVVPEHRGEGVGSRLLAAAEGRLTEAGADVVALEAMADNEAARRFYRRKGYDEHRVEMEKRVGIGGQDADSTDRDPAGEDADP